MHPQSHSSYEAGRLQLHGQPDVVHDRPSDSLVPTDGVIAATPHEVEGTGAKREGSMARERKKDGEKMKKKGNYILDDPSIGVYNTYIRRPSWTAY